MSVREEERNKNSSTSRGLGFAAAAIGVGIGAALYYMFSKRQEERPDSEGSTSDNWTSEPHVFRKRRWSLEECAICFEVMLTEQPLMALPCTHNFHVACIGPWVAERNTCPVCRRAAE